MISEQLYEHILSMPKSAILNLMIAALDEMERCNGQSKTSAIMRAAGAEEIERGWKLPAKTSMAKDWKDNCPVIG